MGSLFRRLRSLAQRAGVDADLREEMETHRALRQAALERGGMAPVTAEAASRRALGNMALAVEAARDVWALRVVDSLWQDVSLFLLRDLTLDLCASNALPAVLTPRSLDLAHLRTASWFHAAEPLARFVTMDVSQAQAAKEMGLRV